jgi:hypothetical protein
MQRGEMHVSGSTATPISADTDDRAWTVSCTLDSWPNLGRSARTHQ